MRNTSPRWRRLVDLVLVATLAAVVLRRRGARASAAVAGAGPAGEPPERDVSVELDSVSLGDDLSVAGGGLDPTLAADVLELNEDAAELFETAEEGFIREPIETATGGAVDVPDVEDELSRRIRESSVSETAIDELGRLGFRGLLGAPERRRRRRQRRRAADAEDAAGDEKGGDDGAGAGGDDGDGDE
jgi:hypothetical protein